MLPAEFQTKMGLGINVGNRIDLWDHEPREIKSSWFAEFKNKGFTNARVSREQGDQNLFESLFISRHSFSIFLYLYLSRSLSPDSGLLAREDWHYGPVHDRPCVSSDCRGRR